MDLLGKDDLSGKASEVSFSFMVMLVRRRISV
jgi:hypothetical protein